MYCIDTVYQTGLRVNSIYYQFDCSKRARDDISHSKDSPISVHIPGVTSDSSLCSSKTSTVQRLSRVGDLSNLSC